MLSSAILVLCPPSFLKGFSSVASEGEESENTVWKTPLEPLELLAKECQQVPDDPSY